MIAYLISDFTREVSADLANQLGSLLDLRIVEPVLIHDNSDLLDKADLATFYARHMHQPLFGEVGCALAHRTVCESFLKTDSDYCVVFEDDVRILDAIGLVSRIQYLSEKLLHFDSCVINLNPDAASRPWWSRAEHDDQIWRTASLTYTTSAYLINRRAAELVIEEQSPIRSQADWPVRIDEVTFFQESRRDFLRVEDLTSSVDPNKHRSQFSRKTKVELWTWSWYLRHRKEFHGLRDYWLRVLKPRIYRHLYSSN